MYCSDLATAVQGGPLEVEEDGDQEVVGQLGPVPGSPYMAHAVSLWHCGTVTGYCYYGDNSFTISALSVCLLQTRLCVVSVQTSLLSKHTRTGLHWPRAGRIGLTPAVLAAVRAR